jgi:hypothetical protein
MSGGGVKPCPKCGEEVSEDWGLCPQCHEVLKSFKMPYTPYRIVPEEKLPLFGRPIKLKSGIKIWLWFLVVIYVATAAFDALFGSGSLLALLIKFILVLGLILLLGGKRIGWHIYSKGTMVSAGFIAVTTLFISGWGGVLRFFGGSSYPDWVEYGGVGTILMLCVPAFITWLLIQKNMDGWD